MGRKKYESLQWQRLKDLHSTHPQWKIKQMAKAMHTLPQCIYHICKTHDWVIDLRTRKYNQRVDGSDKEDIIRMYMEGHTIGEIAEYIGIAYASVRRWLILYKVLIPKVTNPRNYARDIMIARLAAEGRSIKEMAKMTGYTVTQIQNFRTRLRRGNVGKKWWDIYDDLVEKKNIVTKRYELQKQQLQLQKQNKND